MRSKHHHVWSAWSQTTRAVEQTSITSTLKFDKIMNTRRCTDCGYVQESESWHAAVPIE